MLPIGLKDVTFSQLCPAWFIKSRDTLWASAIVETCTEGRLELVAFKPPSWPSVVSFCGSRPATKTKPTKTSTTIKHELPDVFGETAFKSLSDFPQLAQNLAPSDMATPQFVQCILEAPAHGLSLAYRSGQPIVRNGSKADISPRHDARVQWLRGERYTAKSFRPESGAFL